MKTIATTFAMVLCSVLTMEVSAAAPDQISSAEDKCSKDPTVKAAFDHYKKLEQDFFDLRDKFNKSRENEKDEDVYLKALESRKVAEEALDNAERIYKRALEKCKNPTLKKSEG